MPHSTVQTEPDFLPLYPLLRRCPLFSQLPDPSLASALTLLSATRQHYARGEYLHHAGRTLAHFGFVLAGTVQVYADDQDGTRQMMANVAVGETFGESLCYLAVPSPPVHILTAAGAEVLWLDVAPFRREEQTDRFATVIFHRFTAMLAMRTLQMNERIQILSCLSLREKLQTFLAGYARRTGQKTFQIPFDRAALATYLGVNRTALSRELSRMQNEGLLEYYRNSFRLL